MVNVVFAVLVGCVAAGGKLKITWEDCGDSNTKGHITDLQPTEITIGEDGTMTGTGTIDETLTSGSFSIEVRDSFIHKTFTGDACKAKNFTMPLDLGEVFWGGLDCPVHGTMTQKIGFTMASEIPSAFVHASVKATAVDQNKDVVACLSASLAPETEFSV